MREKDEFPWFWGWDEEKQDFAGAGKEPDGNRWNDCHYTNDFKRKAAREQAAMNTSRRTVSHRTENMPPKPMPPATKSRPARSSGLIPSGCGNPIMPELQPMMPELFCWAVMHRKSARDRRSGCGASRRELLKARRRTGTTPIFYLPGISREKLRAAEDCPQELAALVELQYRGVMWLHVNGKEWTPYAFLVSKHGGLGLDVAKDQATLDALAGALPTLMAESVSQLQGRAPGFGIFQRTGGTGRDRAAPALVE